MIDPQLLFQRLVTVGTRHDDLESTFQHELCSYPPALFECRDVVLMATKSVLADALWAKLPSDASGPSDDEPLQYVLDDGALIHRIPWDRGVTYGSICQKYTSYVARRYGNAVVVFDGYGVPSTKDAAHR